MTTPTRAPRDLVFAWLGLALALLVYAAAVLRVDYGRTDLLNLAPEPDAVEYHALARSLFETGRPVIRIGDEVLPSRYPLGWPALTLPWMAMLDEDARILAPFRTNQTIGLFLLLGFFAWFYRRGRPVLAGAGALLLATLPAFAPYARSALSELAAGACVLLALGLLVDGARRSSLARVLLAAALLGLSVNIRLQLVFLAPALLAALFLRPERRFAWLGHGTLALAVYLLGVAPTLAQNLLQFGHPLRTGYHFWVPELNTAGATFALRHVAGNVGMLFDEILGRGGFRVTNLSGSGSYFVPPFLLLAALALPGARLDRPRLCVLLGLGVFLGATLTYYFFQDARLYVPLLLLLVPAAARTIERAWQDWPAGRRRGRAALVFACGALALAGLPGRVGYPPRPGSSVTLHALHWPSKVRVSDRYDALRAFRARFGDRPTLVLTDISPVFASTVMGSGHLAAPIDHRHGYGDSAAWRYGPKEAMALVERATARGVPTFAVQSPRDEDPLAAGRLPTPPGWRWRPAEDAPSACRVWRLEIAPPPAAGERSP